ncbi:RETICULATA-RELATED 4, chloroplastic-like protein, partial [Drosera capensis]
VGTAITNIVINARKAVDKSLAAEAENLPILSTSVGYGVYMAVSSNLRYRIVAGVIEQRILEPLLHKHKLILSALCFAVRTGNTYLGSLLLDTVNLASILAHGLSDEGMSSWTRKQGLTILEQMSPVA